jgi:hypothetical protein
MRLDAINFRNGASWISLKDLIYPVGSIFMKATDTDNPDKIIGDTWAQIQGKFLLGSSESYAIKSIGGEATHTLTIDEMPSHFHPMYNLYYLNYSVTQGNEGHCSNWSSNFSGMANTNNVGGAELSALSLLCQRILQNFLIMEVM